MDLTVCMAVNNATPAITAEKTRMRSRGKKMGLKNFACDSAHPATHPKPAIGTLTPILRLSSSTGALKKPVAVFP